MSVLAPVDDPVEVELPQAASVVARMATAATGRDVLFNPGMPNKREVGTAIPFAIKSSIEGLAGTRLIFPLPDLNQGFVNTKGCRLQR